MKNVCCLWSCLSPHLTFSQKTRISLQQSTTPCILNVVKCLGNLHAWSSNGNTHSCEPPGFLRTLSILKGPQVEEAVTNALDKSLWPLHLLALNKGNCSLCFHGPQAGSGQDYRPHYSLGRPICGLSCFLSLPSELTAHHHRREAVGVKSTPAFCTDSKEIFIWFITVLLQVPNLQQVNLDFPYLHEHSLLVGM